MANLKADLLTQLHQEKYFAEIEMMRLAQDPSMNYKTKLEELGEVLSKIALSEAKMGLAQKYFVDPEQAQAPKEDNVKAAPADNVVEMGQSQAQEVVTPQATPRPHAGQTHAE